MAEHAYKMPCYYPLTGYRSKSLTPNGKRAIVFNPTLGYRDMQVQVSCGQCIGCRLEYSRQWAIRCVHELQMHNESSFVTLTYNNDNLPADNSISKRELQLFIKKLRKVTENKIRYYACGEYGDQNNRPHYHLIIFGESFNDKTVHSESNGNILYRSEMLEKIWTKGYSLIGEVTFESCAYVARYVMKKHKGKDSPEHYEILDKQSGEIHQQIKEFSLMSRRPGIGKTWFEKYSDDTNKDYITIRGQKMSLPKYYDALLEQTEEQESFEKRKGKRRQQAKKRKHDNTTERLAVKEAVKKAQIKFLQRTIEEIKS